MMSFSPPYKLRPYQLTAIRRANNFIEKVNTGFDGAIIEVATGMGKSAILAQIAANCILNKQLPIILTHNIILLEQNIKSLSYWAGIKPEDIALLHRSAEFFFEEGKVFATTPQSLFAKSSLGKNRRTILAKELATNRKIVIIIDEIHWGITENASYERAIKWFKKNGAEKNGLILIGLSATPYMRRQIPAAEREELYRIRNELNDSLKKKTNLDGLINGQSYGEIKKNIIDINSFLLSTHYQMIHNISPLFSKILCQFDLQYGIQNKYLTPPSFYHNSIESVTDELKNSNDFDAAGEVKTRAQEIILERQLVKIWDEIEKLKLKQALIFVPSRKIAFELASFSNNSANFVISGNLGLTNIEIQNEIENFDAKSKEIIESFKRGEIRYLINVGKLTTGFDFPALENIILLRNIRSKALFTQIIGRGMRLFPGKERCRVYDYTATIDGLARQEAYIIALENKIKKTEAESYIFDLNRADIVKRILSSPASSPFKIPDNSQILRKFKCSCGREYTPQREFVCDCGRNVRFVRSGKNISYPFYGLDKHYKTQGGIKYIIKAINEDVNFAKYIAEQYLNWLMFYRIGNFQSYRTDADIIIANALKTYPSIILDELIPDDALIDSSIFTGGDLAIENTIPHPQINCPYCDERIPGNLRKCSICKKELLAACQIPRKIRTEGLLNNKTDNYEILNTISQSISDLSRLEFNYITASIEKGKGSNCWQIKTIFYLTKPIRGRKTYAKYYHFAGAKGRQDFDELKNIGLINAEADFDKTLKRGLPEKQRHHFLLLLAQRLQNLVGKNIFLRVMGDDYYPDVSLINGNYSG